MKFDLLMFKECLFTLKYLEIESNSELASEVSVEKCLCERNKLVSSAKHRGTIDEDAVTKLLMWMKNKRGSRMDPCGTPEVIAPINIYKLFPINNIIREPFVGLSIEAIIW